MRCAPRFAELAGQTMTMRGICDSNATGMKRGHETEEDFCHSGSHSRAVPQQAKEPVELTCHSQCWRLHNRALPPLPRAVSSLSLTLSALVLHPPWSTVTASAVHQRRDSAARPWNARSRRRISPTSAHTSASRICVMCYATVAAPPIPMSASPDLSRAVPLSLQPFNPLLSSYPPLCGRIWSGFDSRRTMQPAAVQRCPKRVWQRRNASRARV